MIQDSGETVCLVTFHDSPTTDAVVATFPAAIRFAIEDMPVDNPRIHDFTGGGQVVLEAFPDDDEKTERVSITTKEIQEDR